MHMTERLKQLPATVFLALLFTLSFPFLSGAADTETPKDRPVPVDTVFKQQEPQVETVADTLEYDKAHDKVIARGNVVITYKDDKITADYAEVESKTKKAYAKGHVIIFSGEKAVAKGDDIHYDFASHTGDFPNGSVLTYPWHCRGQEIQQVKDDKYVAKNAEFTTCTGDNPPYEIHAKKLTVHPGDKLVATGVTFYSLGKPIFWWPFLVVPLQQDSLPFNISPGYSNQYGGYVLTSKGFSITKNIYGLWRADWRSKRGFGGGGDLNYDYGPMASGLIKAYWTQDRRAPTPGIANPYDEREERDRGRLTWWHRTDIDPYSNILLRYHRADDEYFLRDFFKKEDRLESEPQSFVNLTKNGERYGSYLYATKKMNTWESTVDRLPEVNFTWKNQPVPVPDLYYENETTYSNLAKRYKRTDWEQDVNRADHVSKFYLPKQVKDFSVTPFVSGRGTYYSRKRFDGEDTFRLAADYGIDIRNQYYKTYDVSFEKMGIEVNRLRHILEPVVRYEGIKTNVDDYKLEHFDSVDTIHDQNVFTYGLENRLQTKRVVNGRLQRVDIVSLNTFMNFAINPAYSGHGTSFTEVQQELILRPYNWLQYRVDYRYDLLLSEMGSFNQDILVRAKRFRFVFGHRYISRTRQILGQGETEGNQEFVVDTHYKINDLWTIGGYLRWNIDRPSVNEWELSAERNMGCLILEFGYNVRNSAIESNNNQLFFNLRLTDYPTVALRAGEQRGSFAEPRIGETVSGTNQYGDYIRDNTSFTR